jgi:uncharacterized membrane protein YphA (DoxX/SURF4 family)
MTVAIWILSLVLIAEFVASPINLWTGRNMHVFTEFTGFSPTTARRVFAPVMLVGAALIVVGLAVRPLSIVGAAIITCACVLYLVRLAAPGRRAASGIVAYLFFGGVAVALLTLQGTR